MIDPQHGMARLGEPCIQLSQTDSTNSALMQLLREQPDLAEGTLLIAKRQLNGRGRCGRSWFSGEGALACSLLLRPQQSMMHIPSLSLLVAVAVRQALLPVIPAAKIKWPNDILVHGRKLCGILAETHIRQGQLSAVVVGIGLNLIPPEKGWPALVNQPATSIQDWTPLCRDADGWAQHICTELAHYYKRWQRGGFAAVRDDWMQGFAHQGMQLSVDRDGICYQGIAEGVDEYGALLLRHAKGIWRIDSGLVELST